MKEYAKYESVLLKSVKRGLLTKGEAIDNASGYLTAMSDFGIITNDRVSEELSITVKKLLDI